METQAQKSTMNHIIFWQSTPSPHQAAYLRAFAGLHGIENVQFIFTREFEQERRAMGWLEPNYGNLSVIHKPDQKIISELLNISNNKTLHVFSEFVSDSTIRDIMLRAKATRALIGIISEARDWRGYTGLLRKLHSLFFERRFARRADFVLAIGAQASEWFRQCGFSQDKIFEFSYVVEKLDALRVHNIIDNCGLIRLIYVGSLVKLKRVQLLFESLSRLKSYKWQISIIGDGPERIKLANLSKEYGINDRVEFCGSKGNQLVRQALNNTDILILPSYCDGWGAVVNEALMSGARVICSDFCGAAELIKGTTYGGIFQTDSRESLVAVLHEQLSKGSVSWQERQAIIRYSEAFSGPSVAQYLTEIIEFVAGGKMGERPVAPWKLPSHKIDPHNGFDH
jgi:glycosyltransferase involved in cell wall biosynthesis